MKKILLALLISAVLAPNLFAAAGDTEKLSALTRTNLVNATDDIVINSTNDGSATKYTTRRATVASLFAGRDASGMTNLPGMLNVRDFGALGNGVANDTPALSNALYKASLATSSSWVYVPAGTYLITSNLLIYSGTRLTLDPGATIKRNAEIDNMLRNYSDGSVGVWGASSNIVVEGGRWDGNKTAFTSTSTLMAFGHSYNITIRNATFVNGPGSWHMIELNSTRNGRISECTFSNGAASETIQLDICADVGAFPWFGPYDSTECASVTIDRCFFDTCQEGVGTHRWAAGHMNNNIVVRGCTFTNLTGVAVRPYNWSGGIVIEGNLVDRAYRGVDPDLDTTAADPGFVRYDWRIINNRFYNITNEATGQARAIKLKWIEGVVVSGNIISNVWRHGIGIDWYARKFTISDNIIDTCGNAVSGTGHGIYVFGACGGAVIGNVISNCLDNAITIGSVAAVNTTTNITVVGNVCPADHIVLSGSSNIVAYANRCLDFTGVNDSFNDVNGIMTNTIYQPNQVRYSTNSGASVTADFSKRYSLLSTNAAFTWLSPVSVSSTKQETTVTWVTNTTASVVAMICPNAGVATGQIKTNGTWNVTNLTKIVWEHYGFAWTNATASPQF